jgi:hypothetical protein
VTFRSDWAVRLCRTESGVKQVHGTSAAPDLGDEQASWLPLPRPAKLEVVDGWVQLDGCVLAGAPLGEHEVVVIGRRGGPEILDSEVARLGHLAALAVTIAASG